MFVAVMLADQVVHETIDGETVVINLLAGNYYSMEGSAADLWSRLLAGEAPAESATSLARRHGGDAATITAAISAFHRQLFDHGLITTKPTNTPEADGDLGTFEIPQLHVYNDLQAHLLADPVHDVERGTGWPTVAPGQ